MKCSDVERILPELSDGSEGPEVQAHLRACPTCSQLVAELKWIANEARQLGDCDEPPARVWVNIANQLRSEGIIKESLGDPSRRPVLVPRPARRGTWWLVPVAVAILAAGAYQLTHKSASPSPQVARQSSTLPAAQLPGKQPEADVAQSQTRPLASPRPQTQQTAKQSATNPARAAGNTTEQAEIISPPASADDEQFLSEVSQRAPTMRATYENQLRAVNSEIRETQEYISQHPGDLDARQHLMEIYQQKAMLYQMALDRIQ